MIRYLQIENFKSIKRLAFPLEKLNLFFGMNGMGKSSVIQSLLLLRQSYWSNSVKGLQGLHINSELINLGTSSDILCQNADKEEIRFVVCFDKNNRIDVTYKHESWLEPTGVIKIKDLAKANIPFASNESLFSAGFSYLAADHIGPRNEYSATNWLREGINPYGSHGEFIVPFLALEGDRFRVPSELCLEEGKTDRLFDQVSAWMSHISPGVKISARYLPMEERAKLNISYAGQRIESVPFLPVNVGFGIPYVIPLVVSLLTAGKGGLVIVENPESHLHPRGQVKMAELIARVSAQGTQIICESHSDHIINGIRLAVKQGVLASDALAVLYFDKDKEQLTHATEISVDNNGNLSEYPSGLLDEWGLQMAALL